MTTRARALLIVLAVWALAMIVPELYRVIDPLASFGIAVDNDGKVIDVSGPFKRPDASPAARAGVRVGDRVDIRAMRCLPLSRLECRSLTALLGGLGGTQVTLPERAIDLVLADTAGARRTVHLEAARLHASLVDKLVLLLDTLVGIAVVVTAFLLVWTRPGSMTWGFFLYSIWFNPGQTYAYYALLPSPVAVVVQGVLEAVAQGAGFAGLVVFALSFPSETAGGWQRFRGALLALAMVMGLLVLMSLGSLVGVPSERITSIGYGTGFGITAVVLAVLLVRRRTLQPRDRQRMSWVIAGCAIGIPAFIVAEMLQSTAWSQRLIYVFNASHVAGLLYLLNAALTYFVAEAVWRKRVVSVAIPLRRGTILILIGLVVAIPFVTLHEILEHVQEALDQPEWIWALVIAPIALLALHHLHGYAVELADRLFNRRFYAAQRQLSGAGGLMERGGSEGDIDRLLTSAPTQALELTSATLYRKHGEALMPVATANGSLRPLTSERAALAARALETRRFVRLPSHALDTDGSADEACVAIPVASDVLGTIAVVLYGPHENGNDIDDDECEMLMDFAKRAALGYVYVELARLRRQVAELGARHAEATLASIGGD